MSEDKRIQKRRGQRIAEIMYERDVSVEQIAEACSKGTSTVYKWLSGSNNIGSDELKIILDQLNVPIYILDRDIMNLLERKESIVLPGHFRIHNNRGFDRQYKSGNMDFKKALRYLDDLQIPDVEVDD